MVALFTQCILTCRVGFSLHNSAIYSLDCTYSPSLIEWPITVPRVLVNPEYIRTLQRRRVWDCFWRCFLTGLVFGPSFKSWKSFTLLNNLSMIQMMYIWFEILHSFFSQRQRGANQSFHPRCNVVVIALRPASPKANNINKYMSCDSAIFVVYHPYVISITILHCLVGG